MSMRNYGILGYGVKCDFIEPYLNRKQLIKEVYNGELTEEEETELTNLELLECAMEKQDSILEYAHADSEVNGYVLIWAIVPWHLWHEDCKKVKTEEDANNYIWEHLQSFLQPNLKKENFLKFLEHISDSYLG